MIGSQNYDIAVYGGTSAGVVAAVQAARMGCSVVLIAPGRHLGGMTSGGLGATDYGRQNSIGGAAREFYQRVKKYYSDAAAWNRQPASDFRSHGHDPSSDVMWFFEPHVAEQIFRDVLRESGATVVFDERLNRKHGVQKQESRIKRIQMESGRAFSAEVFIDATYEGDLMAAVGADYHVGRESNSVYGETLNGVQTRRVPYNGHNFFRPVDPYVIPGDRTRGLLYGVQSEPPGAEGEGDRRVQAYCFRLCMTDVADNQMPFPKPRDYDPARYELLLRYLLLDGTEYLFADHPRPLSIENPVLGYDPYQVIMPNRKTDSNTKGAISFNFLGANHDYPDADYVTRARIIDEHKSWQQGLIWFVQNDARVPSQFREPVQKWGLAKDEFVDSEHWPHQLYIREARRMVGEYVMTELDCLGQRACGDSIGLGSYTMDSHVTQRYVDGNGFARNEGNIGGILPRPYPISYRALLPQREQCGNLIVPVCCSASHVAYGSIRMEPVFMILGHSAATAASIAVTDDVSMHQIEYGRLKAELLRQGQRLTPTET